VPSLKIGHVRALILIISFIPRLAFWAQQTALTLSTQVETEGREGQKEQGQGGQR
jgi:hypothetical protein